MSDERPTGARVDAVAEGDREVAAARLAELFANGALSHEGFSAALDDVFAAPGRTELEAALAALPPLVRLTPAARRLPGPLVLQATGPSLQLGAGWQLAAETTVRAGSGTVQLDLSQASWDAPEIHLRLESWGAIEVLVPVGVAVQVVSGSGQVALASVAPPLPGGPVLRISTTGPAGVVRVGHPKDPAAYPPARRWRGPAGGSGVPRGAV